MAKKQHSDTYLLRRIISLALPDKWVFIVAIVMAIVLSIIGPLRPFLIQYTVDNYIFKLNLQGLQTMFICLLVLLILHTFLSWSFSYITSWLGQKVVFRLRTKIFNHLTNQQLRYFDTTPVGTSITRTINDVETVNDVFSEGMINIMADLLTIFFILIFMFIQHWQMTLISIVTFPFLFYATYWFKENVKSNFQQVRNAVANLNSFMQESITGMSIIQLFGVEKKQFEKFKKINAHYRDENIKTIWAYSVFFPLIEIISAVAIGLLVWYGSIRIINFDASPGIIISFIMYINMLFRPLRVLADTFNTLQMGLVAADRVFQVVDKNEEIENKGNIINSRWKGKVEFKNVSFSYDENVPVLHDINFTIDAGEVLAIVGATGSGKSSIINVLMRLYPIQNGEIYIDDINIKEYELHHLRQHIGIVLQDVFLFGGTIFDNIQLGNQDITIENVIAIAKQIGAHDFIVNLPNQYEYDVMERGATLSTGQRQLISFIRCMVHNPNILILDEATSSIDTDSEKQIQMATELSIKNRTSIIIAHRLSTIQHANKIMVLDKGKIVEYGSKETLLKQKGAFSALWEAQFTE